jgi:acetylornithine deacetylase/succinyl-diaminopimelate desuccinylase-like protein
MRYPKEEISMNRLLVLMSVALIVVSLTGVKTSIAAEAGPDAQEALALLRDYLRIDTTNPPGNEIKTAEFFKQIFDREGIESRIFESAPGRASIYARLKGDGTQKAIVLLNHMDVVPAYRQFWSVDPFAGEIKDGYIWGRGAVDMKSTGIVELIAMLTLKRQHIPLKADVVFLAVADEEAGGTAGAAFMLKEHFDLLKDAGTVLNEGGSIYAGEDGKVLRYEVSAAEKKPFWLKLTATGTPGHASAPRSDSAVTHLIEALHRIAAHQTAIKVEPVVQKYFADTADFEPNPEKREQFRDLRKSLTDPSFAAQFTQDRRKSAMVRNTISITMLEGSNKINVIPAAASAQLDVRLLPSEDPQAFLTELREVIADDSIKIDTMLSSASYSSPTSGKFFDVLAEVAGENHPDARLTTSLQTGASDCRYFREQAIPCYGFAPFKASNNESGGAHGNDERISLDNVTLGTQMMYQLVRRLAAR